MGRFKNQDESEDLPLCVWKLSGKQKRAKQMYAFYKRAVFISPFG